MKQIYNFEAAQPPALNENVIRSELEKRRKKWQTVLVAMAGILFQTAILLLGLMAADEYPAFEFMSILYVVVSIAGSGAIAIVFAQKKEKIYE